MQAIFKEVRIPVQMFRTEEKATVAIIFERGFPIVTEKFFTLDEVETPA
jgi:hypothetical protein